MKAVRTLVMFILGAIFLIGNPAYSAFDTWINGNTVSFHYDSTLTGLFGDPTVVGNSLFFTPTDFTAIALNNSGSNATNEIFNLEVKGIGDTNIIGANLTEKGAYILDSPTVEEPTVSATGQMWALNGNDPSMNLTDSLIATDAFSHTGLSSKDWEANANLDLGTWGSDKVILTLENILTANAFSTGDTAFIEKTQIVLSVTAVPIPAAIWLFGSALVGLIVTGRRTISE